jgi:hypothetical protein
MEEPDPLQPADAHPSSSSVEGFVAAVERKVQDPIHQRLLRVCREADPTTAMVAELVKIIDEILHET